MSNAILTFLGCGNSTGVPAVGNIWGACDPAEPKNARGRCSVAISHDNTNIVIDTGPEFRAQMNREEIQKLDAVLYTHEHSDHVNGIDELRSFWFRQGALVPSYMSVRTYNALKNRFYYLFEGGNHEIYQPVLDAQIIEDDAFYTAHNIAKTKFTPFPMDHGSTIATGYRFGDLAYCVDMISLDDRALSFLQGVKTWVVDAAGYHRTDNKVHANLDAIYRMNAVIGAEQVVLTSLSLAMDYQTLLKELPDGYIPAYDGMHIAFNI